MGFDEFRRFVNQQEKEKKEKRKGGRLWQLDQLSLEGGEETQVRFLRMPDSRPYVRKFHWPPPGGPHECTADIAAFGGKCGFCHYDQEFKSEQAALLEAAKAKGAVYKKKSSPYNQRTENVMEAVDFRFYHILPGEKPDSPKTVESCNAFGPESDPERCEYCASEEAAIAARVFGGNRRWHLNQDQTLDVYAAHTRLQKFCVHQNTDGTVCGQECYTVGIQCEDCGLDVVDADKVRRMQAKDLEAMSRKEVKCPHCDHVGFVVLEAACKSGAHEALRGTIYDKDLLVSCATEKKKGFDDKEYDKKNFAFDVVSQDWMSIQDSLSLWGFTDEEIVKICKLRDLKDEFRPEWISLDIAGKHSGSVDNYVQAVLDKQAEALNKPNPWSTGPAKGNGQFKGGGRDFQRRS